MMWRAIGQNLNIISLLLAIFSHWFALGVDAHSCDIRIITRSEIGMMLSDEGAPLGKDSDGTSRRTIVDCSSRKLRSIPPDLPHNTWWLDLSDNDLSATRGERFPGHGNNWTFRPFSEQYIQCSAAYVCAFAKTEIP